MTKPKANPRKADPQPKQTVDELIKQLLAERDVLRADNAQLKQRVGLFDAEIGFAKNALVQVGAKFDINVRQLNLGQAAETIVAHANGLSLPEFKAFDKKLADANSIIELYKKDLVAAKGMTEIVRREAEARIDEATKVIAKQRQDYVQLRDEKIPALQRDRDKMNALRVALESVLDDDDYEE